jgi:site-specific recombinase XerD
LADSIKTPRVYKHEYLPLSPSWEDVKKILNNFKGNNPTNIRNYAITLLLSIYGMRCSEVTHLNLDDIDWENELIYLKRAKGSRPQIFPLLHIAGEAIISYIKNARPKNHLAREVFLKVYYPYRPLTSASIYRFVNEALVPLNLNIKHHGPHSLRHACATHLVNEGVSLKIISDHLGHANLDTTMIYARVDINSLRQVCEEFIIGDLL